jgi:phosphotransferase system IIB component
LIITILSFDGSPAIINLQGMNTKSAGLAVVYSIFLSCAAHAQMLDAAKIDSIIGIKGVLNTNEHVFKVTWPRTDVKVSVDGWQMPPFMGLGTWAAFTAGMGDHVMVMGDTVLFQDEVNPAMSVALENGLAVTALHNHFFYDEPKVYFMHIGGEGSAENLAAAVKKVWDKVKEVRTASPQPAKSFGGAALPGTNSITEKTIEDILGVKGQANNGMFKVVIGRTAKMMDTEVAKEMGVNTWAAFAGSDDNAIVDGDFAVVEDELQPALKFLRHDGINIVAIHSHMTHENPRILFFHYWGQGKAADLAKALKQALPATNK